MEHRPLALLDSIEDETDEYTHAIFGSLELDPGFFEGTVLPLLHERYVENVLVLVDKDTYHTTAGIRQAGRSYYLEPVNVGGLFHPKFILLVWPDGAKLIVGSANLTKRGWAKNGELVIDLVADRQRPDPEADTALAGLHSFLRILLDEGEISDPKHRRKLSQTLQAFDWVNNRDHEAIDSVDVLHNLQRPLLDEFLDRSPGDIMEATVLAPFHDRQVRVLHEFADAGADRIRLLIQEEKVQGLDPEGLRELEEKNTEVVVEDLHMTDRASRWIHGKAYLLRNEDVVMGLFGSANCTKQAMLTTASQGNAELCVYRRASRPDYFDYLFTDDAETGTKIPLEDLTYRAIDLGTTEAPSADFPLTGASYEQGMLTVEFNADVDWEKGELRLLPSRKDVQSQAITLGEVESPLTKKIPPSAQDILDQACQVQIALDAEGTELESTRRWISTDYLDRLPKRKDIQEIEKTQGRKGLIDLLGKLWKDETGLEVLQLLLDRLTFEDLGANADLARRTFRDRQVAENDEPGILAEPEPFDPAEIARERLDQEDRRFQQNLNEVEDVALEERIPSMTNHFLFINRIRLFFVLKENFSHTGAYGSGKADSGEDPFNLNELRKTIRQMEAFHDRLRRAEAVSESSWAENLIPHFLVLAYCVDELHDQAGFPQRQPAVHNSFREIYRDVLGPWIDSSDIEKPWAFSTDSVDATCAEHDDFEGPLRPSTRDLRYFCIDLFREEE